MKTMRFLIEIDIIGGKYSDIFGVNEIKIKKFMPSSPQWNCRVDLQDAFNQIPIDLMDENLCRYCVSLPIA